MRYHGSKKFLIEEEEWVRENGLTCQSNPVGIWMLSKISGKISIFHVTRYNEGGIRSQGSAIKLENVFMIKFTPYFSFTQKHLEGQIQHK
jgi:hypothetical protein